MDYMDRAMKCQLAVCVLFVTLASVMVHFTITKSTPVLGTCTVFERCHWYSRPRISIFDTPSISMGYPSGIYLHQTVLLAPTSPTFILRLSCADCMWHGY